MNMKKKEKKGLHNKTTNTKKGKSKFSNKYSERIASIKESDEKAKIKTEKEENRKNKRPHSIPNHNSRFDYQNRNIHTENSESQNVERRRPKSARGRRSNINRKED